MLLGKQNLTEMNAKAIFKTKLDPKTLKKMSLQGLPMTVPQLSLGTKFFLPIKSLRYAGVQMRTDS